MGLFGGNKESYKDKKSLVIYFSRADENYAVGYIDKGNTEYIAEYFIGNSYLNPLAKIEDAKLSLFNVTFEPGCRNNWHIHHASKGGGQVLICVAGEGC